MATEAPTDVRERVTGYIKHQAGKSNEAILDLVLDQSKSLRRKLGAADQRKLAEYETSVREVEQGIERSRDWLNSRSPSSTLASSQPRSR